MLYMPNIAHKNEIIMLCTHTWRCRKCTPIKDDVRAIHISSSTVPKTILYIFFLYCQHLNLLNSRNPHKFQEILSLFWNFYLDFFFFIWFSRVTWRVRKNPLLLTILYNLHGRNESKLCVPEWRHIRSAEEVLSDLLNEMLFYVCECMWH